MAFERRPNWGELIKPQVGDIYTVKGFSLKLSRLATFPSFDCRAVTQEAVKLVVSTSALQSAIQPSRRKGVHCTRSMRRNWRSLVWGTQCWSKLWAIVLPPCKRSRSERELGYIALKRSFAPARPAY